MQEAEERMSLEIRKTSVILSYLRYCNVWVFSSLFFIVRTFGFCLFQRLMRRQSERQHEVFSFIGWQVK